MIRIYTQDKKNKAFSGKETGDLKAYIGKPVLVPIFSSTSYTKLVQGIGLATAEISLYAVMLYGKCFGSTFIFMVQCYEKLLSKQNLTLST